MRQINRDILKLAIPSILANITVPLVGMADIAVAGHLGTDAAAMIGGIAIGSMLFDLLYWNFGFLRIGTGGLAAQAYGRGDRHESVLILLRSLAIALSCAFILIAVQWLFVKAAFLIVDCSPQVRSLASDYFFIRIWAAPATLSLMALKGWFIGMQDSFSPMLTDFVVNGVNILMSILLALGFAGIPGMGFRGIAVGTVVAQWTGLLTASGLLYFRYRRSVLKDFSPGEYRGIFKGNDTRRFFVMNTDLFIRSLCFIAVYIGFTTISARYGDILLATSSIMMKLLLLFSYFTDGFAYAGEAMTGRYIGEMNAVQLKKTVKWTFIWSMGIAVMFMGGYHWAGEQMLAMMTSDVSVVGMCREYMPWLLLMPLTGCAAFTWDGIYIGATASRQMRNSMLWATVAFVLVWGIGVLLLDLMGYGSEDYGVIAMHVLMAAYFAHLAVRAFYLTLKYRSSILI